MQEEERLIEAQKLIANLHYNNLWRPIFEERHNKMTYEHNLRVKLGIEKYWYNESKRGELNILQISLDKIQLANNSSRGRSFKLCSSVKEVDHHSLHFGFLHGIKNISEEKKILKKLKEVEKDSSSQCTTFVENNLTYPIDTRKQQQTEEEEIERCVVNGKKWRSLGTKEEIVKKIKSLYEFVGVEDDIILLRKKLTTVRMELHSLDKLLNDCRKVTCEAQNFIYSNNKVTEMQLWNYINSLKERPISMKNIEKALKKLQHEVQI